MNDTAAPTTQQLEMGITLVDLSNMLQIIDLASARGAFRAAELEPVGALYNKVKKFVDAATAIEAAKQEQQTPTAVVNESFVNG
jgi:hypothetical protein